MYYLGTNTAVLSAQRFHRASPDMFSGSDKEPAGQLEEKIKILRSARKHCLFAQTQKETILSV